MLQVRAILDAAGGREVKVIPCDDAMLYEPMSRAVSLPEPDWEQPRPEGWTRGGAWGSQRTILFSGMKCAPPTTRPCRYSQQGCPPFKALCAEVCECLLCLLLACSAAWQSICEAQSQPVATWPVIRPMAIALPLVDCAMANSPSFLCMQAASQAMLTATQSAQRVDWKLTVMLSQLHHQSAR